MEQRAGLTPPVAFRVRRRRPPLWCSRARNAAARCCSHRPSGQGRSAPADREKQCLVEKLVAHATVEALDEPVLRRLARRDIVPLHAGVARPRQHRVRGQLSPVVADDHPGCAAFGNQIAQLANHPRPEIDVSSTARKHSRVTSSTILRMRNRLSARESRAPEPPINLVALHVRVRGFLWVFFAAY